MNWIYLLINLAFASFVLIAPQQVRSATEIPSSNDLAIEPTPTLEPIAVQPPDIGSSAVLRSQNKFWLTLNFSPIDFLVPRKIGTSLGYSPDPQKIYELELLKSRYSPLVSSNLGTLNDQRISLLYRSFGHRNSFNYQWGISYLSTNLELGNYLYSKLVRNYPFSKAFEIQSVGLQFGIGNEWVFFPKFPIPVRVDWISITQPIFSLKQEAPILDYLGDNAATDSINKILTIAQWTPRFALLKIEAGFTF